MAVVRIFLAWVVCAFMFALAPAAAQAQPVFSAQLSDDTIAVGAISTLTFTINNGSSGVPAEDAAFSLTLPTGVTVAASGEPILSPTCTNGVLSAANSGSSISLTGADIGGGDVCTAQVNVTSSTAGTVTLLTGDLTSSLGNSDTATDDLTVDTARVGFSKTLSAATIDINGTTTITYLVDNSANGSTYVSASFSESLPSGIEVAPTPNIQTTAGCSAINTSGISGSTISVNSLIVLANTTCEVSVDVRATAAGSFDLLSGALSGALPFFIQSSGKSLATLTVNQLPTNVPQVQKFFVDDPVNPGGTATLEFIISNGSSSAATDISFTDDLDAMLTGATLDAGTLPGNPCGAGSSVSGSSVLTLTGASLEGRTSCTFSVGLLIPATTAGGNYPSTTSALTATVSGSPVTGNAATDTLIVNTALVPQPVFSKEFIDDPVQPGNNVTLRYTIQNTSTTIAVTDLAFTDEFDFISVSPVSASGAVCNGGNVSIIPASSFTPSTSIIYSSGAVNPNTTCTFDVVLAVDATEATATHVSTSTALSYNDGNSTETAPAASDTLVVGGIDLTFNKSFTEDNALPGDTVELTFSLENNEESVATASSIAFTDDLDAFFSGSALGSVTTNTCGGSATGTGTLSYTGGSLAPGATCEVVANVILGGGSPNTDVTNTTSTLTASGAGLSITVPAATDDIFISSAEPLDVAFAVTSPAIPGETVTFTVTLTNPNGSPTTSVVASSSLTSGLAGLSVSSLPTNGFCGAGSSASGTTFLILTGLEVAASDSCTFQFDALVPTSAADGDYTVQMTTSSTISGVNLSDFSSTTLTVDSVLLTMTQTFLASAVSTGASVDVEFTVENTSSATTVSDIAFTADIDAAISGATASGLPASNVCGTGSTLSGTSTLSLAGGTLAPGASCTFTATIAVPGAASTGSASLVTSALSGTAINPSDVSGVAAQASITVTPSFDLALSKAFSPATVGAGNTTGLTLTLVNSGAGTANGVSLSDDLGAMLSGTTASNLVASAGCGGGSFTGSSALGFSGGDIGPGETCTLTADVTLPAGATPGGVTNTTSAVFASGIEVASAATASLTVATPPSFAKVFAPDALGVGQTSTLTFTIDNSANAATVTALDFSDVLPSNVVVASTPNAATTCTGGTLTATAGGGTITYTGGSLAASASCTVSVDVTSATAGSYSNLSGALTSFFGDSGTATDSVEFVPQPGFAMAFAPADILLGATSTLTLTVDNSGSSIAATALDFTNSLPSGVVIATPANAATSCTGGTVTGTSGTSALSYTGGTVAAGATCTVTADVTPSATGSFVNTSGDLTSSLGNSGTASDTLTVTTPEIGMSGSIGGAVASGGTLAQGDQPAGTEQVLTVTVSNTGDADLTLDATPVTSAASNVTLGTVSGPALTTVSAASSTTFTVAYTPDVAGAFSFGVSLGNSDVDEDPYTFTVSGTGLDVTAPAGYTVSLDQDPVTSANETAVSFTFGAAEVGATYDFTLTSDGGGTAVTGSGTVTSASAQVTGIDASGLGDGTLTLTATLTDGAGNTGLDATDTAAKDATAPAGYTATLDDDPVNGANVTSTGFTFSGAEVGAAYSYTIASDGGGTPVTGTGTIASATDQITGLDLSAVADGTLTLTVSLTDTVGNTGLDATDTATKDAAAPAGYSVAFASDPVNVAIAASTGFGFAGAEVGAGFVYSITSDAGGTPVTGAGTISGTTEQITGLDLSGLSDGTLTVTASLTDVAGNAGADVTDTATKDATAPSLSIDTPIAGDGVVNAAEAAGLSVSGTSSDLSDGRPVSVTVSDSASGSVSGTATVGTNAWSVTLDLSALADGPLTITADAQDSAGNMAAQASTSISKDTTAPAGYTVAFDADPINLSNETAASFSFAAAEVGASYSFSIASDGGGTAVTGSGTVSGTTEQVAGLDLSGLGDGTLTLTASLTDPAGNTGLDATDTAAKDATAPSLAIDAPIAGDDVVNGAEASAVTISGTSTGLADGQTVTVSVADAASGSVAGSATVASDVWSVTLDLTALADGALSVTADALDAAGNMAAQASATATQDATAPSGYAVAFDADPINLSNETAASFSFAGAEVGAAYSFAITSDAGGTAVTGSGTIASAAEQITGLDLSGLGDGTLTVTASLTDPAGNTGVDATGTATKDATAPSLTIDTPIAGEGVVNAAEAGATTVSGSATDLSDGAQVAIAVSDGASGSATGTATVSGGLWSASLDLSALADGALSVTADAQDGAGNAAPTATATATKDATAPTGYTVAFTDDPVSLANVASSGFGFAGAEVGAAYSFTITSDGGGTPVTGAGTIASAGEPIAGLDFSGLNDGTLTVVAVLTDAAGNAGADATDTALKDAGMPTVVLDGPDDAQSGAFAVTATFSEPVTGFAVAGLTLSQGVASNVTGSGTDFSFTVTPDFDGEIEIFANAGAAQDTFGNASALSDTITVTADLTGTPNPTPAVDDDGDGVPDGLESTVLDRDGDGIPDAEDFDPQGYFYCEDDGRIIPGGSFTVSGPSGSNSGLGLANDIRITRDGSTGEIQWFAQRPGVYSVALSYPTAVGIPSTTRTPAGTLDLTTLLPADPAVIGSSQVGSSGFLADGSLAANPVFYTSFDIRAGDPFVLSNNYPMTQCATNAVTSAPVSSGAEANGGAPTAVVFEVSQTRVSTQDTVVSYTMGGAATAGADFTAPSGSVTIPAGDTSAQVSVAVLEDSEIEGTETLALTITAVSAGDLTTQLGTAVTASANIADDEQADVVVTDVDLTASENGDDTAAMDFVLLGAPTSNVTLTFVGDAQCTVSPATMTFTSTTFAATQRLTIAAIDDDDVEGVHSCQPAVTVSSADTRFDALPLALSAVVVADDLVDQVRTPLTEILEENLEQTVRTQQRSFGRIAKGALSRLQEGSPEGRCGVLSSFDVDGSLEIQDANGTAQGVFGSDVMNCANNVREILDGSFELSKTEDHGMQATLQFSMQRERFVSENALQGYFVGGYFNRTNVDGNGGEGRIDGYGVNGGLYGARGYSSGLFVDYYLAGAVGHHRFDIDFDANPADITATGDYNYLAGFAGVGLSGQVAYDSYTMTPRVGLDWAHARAGDVDVTARQLGQTDSGVIELSDYNGVTATAEVIFESLVAPRGADAMQTVTRTTIAPRLACNLSSFDDDADCGVGLAFGWERTDTANGLTYGIELDLEHMNDTQRLLLDLRRERPFSRGQGAVVTRLLVPTGQDVMLEHGVRLDW